MPGGGVGNTQIIQGIPYVLYSPEWYAAQKQNEISKAQTAGTAAGSGAKSALDALGVSVGGTPASTSSAGIPGFTTPPHVGGGGGTTPDFSAFDSPSGVGSAGQPPRDQISLPDFRASESAAYGRAKDAIGQQTSGALSGLQSAMAARGMLGGQGEYLGMQGIATAGQGQLGEAARSQAQQELADTLDIEKANLGAGVTERGQDITSATERRGQNMGYAETTRGQDITQRGQDIQQQDAMAQLALTKSLADAARQQQILSGIMGAINSNVGTLY